MLDHQSPGPAEAFGSILGYAPGGVPAYSSDYDSADEKEFADRYSYRSFVDGVFMGMKWQCVEFARRWLYSNLGWVFDDVAMAYDIFRLQSATEIGSGRQIPLRSFRNGSRRRPEPGAMLIWNEGGHFSTTGHVAIITAVGESSVRIAEQNFAHHKWPGDRDYSRELTMIVSDAGEIRIDGGGDNAEILGWVMQTDDDSCAESFETTDPSLMNLELCEIAGETGHEDTWLDPARPEEAAYIASEGHALARDAELRRNYLRVSESALAELKRATTELHALFLAATDHVLRNEALLRKFNLPKALWPRIRASWNGRRNELISGRFDFALSERGLKVYEYNCDSCSCHMEAGQIQGRWADHYGNHDGYDAGRLLSDRLTLAWRKADVDDVIHIMHDRDNEEAYHALYMKKIIENAGLETRVLRGLKGLDWGPDGSVVDPDGRPIRWVWKTWAWETALDQIRGECEDDDEALRTGEAPSPGDHAPRLVDVLLRPDVMVYEPLWTLIPSNKAILPVLWRISPNHPRLLRSAFELRSELEATGYAVKPIVGRGGANISLVNRKSDLVAETPGNFEERDQVYQELWRLPSVDGLNVQVSTFSAGGAYAGACTRVDRSLVINMKSDCLPLRVVPDNRLSGKGRLVK